MSTQDILTLLDHSNDGYYCYFIPLNHPYVYLIDTRLNLFRDGDNWAIAAEILGYPPRGGHIELQIFYHGNCLVNLEQYNYRNTNSNTVFPVDEDSYNETVVEEALNPAANTMLVRGITVALSHNKTDYERAGIELVEFEPGRIDMHEVARLLIVQNQDVFRATDEELYKSIPRNLKKILVLDEWYHKDFTVSPPKILSDAEITGIYKLNRHNGGLHGMDSGDLTATIRAQEARASQFAQAEWDNARPSSYETWQQLAKVLATGDTAFYKPTQPTNTHWKNWPESGSL